MLSDVLTHSCVVDLAGAAALDILCSNRAGKVLASVTQALYLLDEQDHLLWLATPGIPMHRRGVRISGPLPRPAVGAPFQVRQGILMFDTGECLDLGACPVWKKPETLVAQAIALARLPGLVNDTYRTLLEWLRPVGMGSLIPAILQMATPAGQPDPIGLGTQSLQFLWRPVHKIVQACLRWDSGLLLERAERLVGLGNGLTPSGDDFLGGLFFAFELLRRTYPEIRELQIWNNSNFIIENQTRTNPISFCLLKDHAAGFAMEPMHRFAEALLEGQRIDQSLPLAAELVGVGHSTGWDLLTGVLAGMMILFSQ